MAKPKFLLGLIFLITILALLVALPAELPFIPQINLSLGPLQIRNDLEIKKGLDLQGGSHLVLEAEMGEISSEDQATALESARDIIARRVDLYGINEAVIQTIKTEGQARIVVELPGAKNIKEAIDLIGQTARLDFRELPAEKKASPSAGLQAKIFDFRPTELTGRDLKRAQVQFDPQTGEPMVGIIFDAVGTEKFAAITRENVGYPVAIFLDDLPVTAPQVNEPITQGQAVISGDFDLKEAKKLAVQLNAGALPVPVKIVEQKTIGATLGKESVEKSIRAGLIGLGLVCLFMILFYGRFGLLADIGLVIYGLVTLALYKLIPVTLTLPGLAGFLLSVGMAVDANILIFERIKEERRGGQSLKTAMELGFGRAWDSIKDANVCTLIICFILFNPFNWGWLNNSGMVRGFALTLGLGLGLSLFTGIVVSRTLIRLFYKNPKS